ncbi:hypothetical protein TNCV_3657481 [Trichonephila clavipes]|nr:hypothetical protein TNCV_3657481 [Trichonephila clavipes]
MILRQNQIKARKVKRRPLFFHLYICSDTESREEKARHGDGFKWITLEKHMWQITNSHGKYKETRQQNTTTTKKKLKQSNDPRNARKETSYTKQDMSCTSYLSSPWSLQSFTECI